MYVVDQHTLTSLARAWRHNIARSGGRLSHQSALNILIAAFGMDSSNRAAAILRERPLMIAADPRAEAFSWPTAVVVAQLARLVLDERRRRRATRMADVRSGSDDVFGLGSGLGLPRMDTRDLIAAACRAGRVSSSGGGLFHAIELPLDGGRLSKVVPFTLEMTDKPHPPADGIGITPALLIERASWRLRGQPSHSQPARPVYMDIEIDLEQAAQATLHAMPGGIEWVGQAVAGLCGLEWPASPGECLSGTRGHPLRELGLAVVRACAERNLLGLAKPSDDVLTLQPGNIAPDDPHAHLLWNRKAAVTGKDDAVRQAAQALREHIGLSRTAGAVWVHTGTGVPVLLVRLQDQCRAIADRLPATFHGFEVRLATAARNVPAETGGMLP